MEKEMTLPNLVKETSEGVRAIALNDELYSQREIYLNSDINEDTALKLIKQLMYLEKNMQGAPITLYINSPGGSVRDGLAVYDVMRMMKSPITTVCMGLSASMAAIIFLAADERLILPHSEIMIHDASFGNAQFSGLKPDEIRERADELMKTSKVLRNIVAERTGQSIRIVSERMKKDSYFNSEEAVRFNLATDILGG